MSSSAVEYGGLGRRFVAAVIDNAFWLIAASLLISVLAGSTLDEIDSTGEVGEGDAAELSIMFVVVFSLWFNYFAVAEWRWGQTIGKNAMGLIVVRGDGSSLGFEQASLRNIARLVDAIGIGWVMIATSRRRRRLGDRWADTVVVRRGSEAALRAASATGAEHAAAEADGPTGVEREERGRMGRLPDVGWGAGRAVLAVILAPLAATLIGIVLVAPFDPDLESTAGLLVLQATLGASFITASLLVASRFSPGAVSDGIEALGLGRFRGSHIGWGLLAWGGYLLATLVYVSIFGVPEQEDIARELGIDESVAATAAVVFLICFFGPLSEEMIFRGLLFGGLRTRFGFMAAALISAGLFGVVHLNTGATTVIPLAIFGFALAAVYERTGSLWPAVVAHVINNSLVVLPTVIGS